PGRTRRRPGEPRWRDRARGSVHGAERRDRLGGSSRAAGQQRRADGDQHPAGAVEGDVGGRAAPRLEAGGGPLCRAAILNPLPLAERAFPARGVSHFHANTCAGEVGAVRCHAMRCRSLFDSKLALALLLVACASMAPQPVGVPPSGFTATNCSFEMEPDGGVCELYFSLILSSVDAGAEGPEGSVVDGYKMLTCGQSYMFCGRPLVCTCPVGSSSR